MSRGSLSDWLVLGRPTHVDLSALYDGWLCRAVSTGDSDQSAPATAWCSAPEPQAAPEFIWASHPS